MFANPVEKLYVACLWHREIVYHSENHYSLSFKNKIAFSIYLPIFLFVCIGGLCPYFRGYHLSSVCGKDQKMLKEFRVKSVKGLPK